MTHRAHLPRPAGRAHHHRPGASSTHGTTARGTPARFAPPNVPFFTHDRQPRGHHEHRKHAPGDMQGPRR